MASDSLLTGGGRWDVAPKIMALPRDDSVLAFAGDTGYGYPLMLQAVNTVASYDRAFNRHLSLDELHGHILRIFNDMLRHLTELPRNEIQPARTDFLLGGYDWRALRFRLWRFVFDPAAQTFSSERVPIGGRALKRRFAFVGDGVDDASERLLEVLRAKGALRRGGHLDMEPLQVVAQMIEANEYPMIGGFPQVMKVYRSLRVQPFGVIYNDQACLHGRPLMDYEHADRVPMLTVSAQGVNHPGSPVWES